MAYHDLGKPPKVAIVEWKVQAVTDTLALAP
jgi:hypothetical protein